MKKFKVTNISTLLKSVKDCKHIVAIKSTQLEDAKEVLKKKYIVHTHDMLSREAAISCIEDCYSYYGPISHRDAANIVDRAAITKVKEELTYCYVIFLNDNEVNIYEALVDFNRNDFYDIIVEDQYDKDYIKVLSRSDLF